MPKKTIEQQIDYQEKSTTLDVMTRMSCIIRDLQDEMTRLSRRFGELEEESRKLNRSVSEILDDEEASIADDHADSALLEEQKRQNELIQMGLTALISMLSKAEKSE